MGQTRMKDIIAIARSEGRVCSNCQRMISKANWKKLVMKVKPLCPDCAYAFRGVVAKGGYWPTPDDRPEHR